MASASEPLVVGWSTFVAPLSGSANTSPNFESGTESAPFVFFENNGAVASVTFDITQAVQSGENVSFSLVSSGGQILALSTPVYSMDGTQATLTLSIADDTRSQAVRSVTVRAQWSRYEDGMYTYFTTDVQAHYIYCDAGVLAVQPVYIPFVCNGVEWVNGYAPVTQAGVDVVRLEVPAGVEVTLSNTVDFQSRNDVTGQYTFKCGGSTAGVKTATLAFTYATVSVERTVSVTLVPPMSWSLLTSSQVQVSDGTGTRVYYGERTVQPESTPFTVTFEFPETLRAAYGSSNDLGALQTLLERFVTVPSGSASLPRTWSLVGGNLQLRILVPDAGGVTTTATAVNNVGLSEESWGVHTDPWGSGQLIPAAAPATIFSLGASIVAMTITPTVFQLGAQSWASGYVPLRASGGSVEACSVQLPNFVSGTPTLTNTTNFFIENNGSGRHTVSVHGTVGEVIETSVSFSVGTLTLTQSLSVTLVPPISWSVATAGDVEVENGNQYVYIGSKGQLAGAVPLYVDFVLPLALQAAYGLSDTPSLTALQNLLQEFVALPESNTALPRVWGVNSQTVLRLSYALNTEASAVATAGTVSESLVACNNPWNDASLGVGGLYATLVTFESVIVDVALTTTRFELGGVQWAEGFVPLLSNGSGCEAFRLQLPSDELAAPTVANTSNFSVQEPVYGATTRAYPIYVGGSEGGVVTTTLSVTIGSLSLTWDLSVTLVPAISWSITSSSDVLQEEGTRNYTYYNQLNADAPATAPLTVEFTVPQSLQAAYALGDAPDAEALRELVARFLYFPAASAGLGRTWSKPNATTAKLQYVAPSLSAAGSTQETVLTAVNPWGVEALGISGFPVTVYRFTSEVVNAEFTPRQHTVAGGGFDRTWTEGYFPTGRSVSFGSLVLNANGVLNPANSAHLKLQLVSVDEDNVETQTDMTSSTTVTTQPENWSLSRAADSTYANHITFSIQCGIAGARTVAVVAVFGTVVLEFRATLTFVAPPEVTDVVTENAVDSRDTQLTGYVLYSGLAATERVSSQLSLQVSVSTDLLKAEGFDLAADASESTVTDAFDAVMHRWYTAAEGFLAFTQAIADEDAWHHDHFNVSFEPDVRTGGVYTGRVTRRWGDSSWGSVTNLPTVTEVLLTSVVHGSAITASYTPVVPDAATAVTLTDNHSNLTNEGSAQVGRPDIATVIVEGPNDMQVGYSVYRQGTAAGLQPPTLSWSGAGANNIEYASDSATTAVFLRNADLGVSKYISLRGTRQTIGNVALYVDNTRAHDTQAGTYILRIEAMATNFSTLHVPVMVTNVVQFQLSFSTSYNALDHAATAGHLFSTGHQDSATPMVVYAPRPFTAFSIADITISGADAASLTVVLAQDPLDSVPVGDVPADFGTLLNYTTTTGATDSIVNIKVNANVPYRAARKITVVVEDNTGSITLVGYLVYRVDPAALSECLVQHAWNDGTRNWADDALPAGRAGIVVAQVDLPSTEAGVSLPVAMQDDYELQDVVGVATTKLLSLKPGASKTAGAQTLSVSLTYGDDRGTATRSVTFWQAPSTEMTSLAGSTVFPFESSGSTFGIFNGRSSTVRSGFDVNDLAYKINIPNGLLDAVNFPNTAASSEERLVDFVAEWYRLNRDDDDAVSTAFDMTAIGNSVADVNNMVSVTVKTLASAATASSPDGSGGLVPFVTGMRPTFAAGAWGTHTEVSVARVFTVKSYVSESAITLERYSSEVEGAEYENVTLANNNVFTNRNLGGSQYSDVLPASAEVVVQGLRFLGPALMPVGIVVWNTAEGYRPYDNALISGSVGYNALDATHPALRLVRPGTPTTHFVQWRGTQSELQATRMNLAVDLTRSVQARNGEYAVRFLCMGANFDMPGMNGDRTFDISVTVQFLNALSVSFTGDYAELDHSASSAGLGEHTDASAPMVLYAQPSLEEFTIGELTVSGTEDLVTVTLTEECADNTKLAFGNVVTLLDTGGVNPVDGGDSVALIKVGGASRYFPSVGVRKLTFTITSGSTTTTLERYIQYVWNFATLNLLDMVSALRFDPDPANVAGDGAPQWANGWYPQPASGYTVDLFSVTLPENDGMVVSVTEAGGAVTATANSATSVTLKANSTIGTGEQQFNVVLTCLGQSLSTSITASFLQAPAFVCTADPLLRRVSEGKYESFAQQSSTDVAEGEDQLTATWAMPSAWLDRLGYPSDAGSIETSALALWTAYFNGPANMSTTVDLDGFAATVTIPTSADASSALNFEVALHVDASVASADGTPFVAGVRSRYTAWGGALSADEQAYLVSCESVVHSSAIVPQAASDVSGTAAALTFTSATKIANVLPVDAEFEDDGVFADLYTGAASDETGSMARFLSVSGPADMLVGVSVFRGDDNAPAPLTWADLGTTVAYNDATSPAVSLQLVAAPGTRYQAVRRTVADLARAYHVTIDTSRPYSQVRGAYTLRFEYASLNTPVLDVPMVVRQEGSFSVAFDDLSPMTADSVTTPHVFTRQTPFAAVDACVLNITGITGTLAAVGVTETGTGLATGRPVLSHSCTQTGAAAVLTLRITEDRPSVAVRTVVITLEDDTGVKTQTVQLIYRLDIATLSACVTDVAYTNNTLTQAWALGYVPAVHEHLATVASIVLPEHDGVVVTFEPDEGTVIAFTGGEIGEPAGIMRLSDADGTRTAGYLGNANEFTVVSKHTDPTLVRKVVSGNVVFTYAGSTVRRAVSVTALPAPTVQVVSTASFTRDDGLYLGGHAYHVTAEVDNPSAVPAVVVKVTVDAATFTVCGYTGSLAQKWDAFLAQWVNLYPLVTAFSVQVGDKTSTTELQVSFTLNTSTPSALNDWNNDNMLTGIALQFQAMSWGVVHTDVQPLVRVQGYVHATAIYPQYSTTSARDDGSEFVDGVTIRNNDGTEAEPDLVASEQLTVAYGVRFNAPNHLWVAAVAYRADDADQVPSALAWGVVPGGASWVARVNGHSALGFRNVNNSDPPTPFVCDVAGNWLHEGTPTYDLVVRDANSNEDPFSVDERCGEFKVLFATMSANSPSVTITVNVTLASPMTLTFSTEFNGLDQSVTPGTLGAHDTESNPMIVSAGLSLVYSGSTQIASITVGDIVGDPAAVTFVIAESCSDVTKIAHTETAVTGSFTPVDATSGTLELRVTHGRTKPSLGVRKVVVTLSDTAGRRRFTAYLVYKWNVGSWGAVFLPVRYSPGGSLPLWQTDCVPSGAAAAVPLRAFEQPHATLEQWTLDLSTGSADMELVRDVASGNYTLRVKPGRAVGALTVGVVATYGSDTSSAAMASATVVGPPAWVRSTSEPVALFDTSAGTAVTEAWVETEGAESAVVRFTPFDGAAAAPGIPAPGVNTTAMQFLVRLGYSPLVPGMPPTFTLNTAMASMMAQYYNVIADATGFTAAVTLPSAPNKADWSVAFTCKTDTSSIVDGVDTPFATGVRSRFAIWGAAADNDYALTIRSHVLDTSAIAIGGRRAASVVDSTAVALADGDSFANNTGGAAEDLDNTTQSTLAYGLAVSVPPGAGALPVGISVYKSVGAEGTTSGPPPDLDLSAAPSSVPYDRNAHAPLVLRARGQVSKYVAVRATAASVASNDYELYLDPTRTYTQKVGTYKVRFEWATVNRAVPYVEVLFDVTLTAAFTVTFATTAGLHSLDVSSAPPSTPIVLRQPTGMFAAFAFAQLTIAGATGVLNATLTETAGANMSRGTAVVEVDTTDANPEDPEAARVIVLRINADYPSTDVRNITLVLEDDTGRLTLTRALVYELNPANLTMDACVALQRHCYNTELDAAPAYWQPGYFPAYWPEALSVAMITLPVTTGEAVFTWEEEGEDCTNGNLWLVDTGAPVYTVRQKSSASDGSRAYKVTFTYTGYGGVTTPIEFDLTDRIVSVPPVVVQRFNAAPSVKLNLTVATVEAVIGTTPETQITVPLTYTRLVLSDAALAGCVADPLATREARVAELLRQWLDMDEQALEDNAPFVNERDGFYRNEFNDAEEPIRGWIYTQRMRHTVAGTAETGIRPRYAQWGSLTSVQQPYVYSLTAITNAATYTGNLLRAESATSTTDVVVETDAAISNVGDFAPFGVQDLDPESTTFLASGLYADLPDDTPVMIVVWDQMSSMGTSLSFVPGNGSAVSASSVPYNAGGGHPPVTLSLANNPAVWFWKWVGTAGTLRASKMQLNIDMDRPFAHRNNVAFMVMVFALNAAFGVTELVQGMYNYRRLAVALSAPSSLALAHSTAYNALDVSSEDGSPLGSHDVENAPMIIEVPEGPFAEFTIARITLSNTSGTPAARIVSQSGTGLAAAHIFTLDTAGLTATPPTVDVKISNNNPSVNVRLLVLEFSDATGVAQRGYYVKYRHNVRRLMEQSVTVETHEQGVGPAWKPGFFPLAPGADTTGLTVTLPELDPGSFSIGGFSNASDVSIALVDDGLTSGFAPTAPHNLYRVIIERGAGSGGVATVRWTWNYDSTSVVDESTYTLTVIEAPTVAVQSTSAVVDTRLAPVYTMLSGLSQAPVAEDQVVACVTFDARMLAAVADERTSDTQSDADMLQALAARWFDFGANNADFVTSTSVPSGSTTEVCIAFRPVVTATSVSDNGDQPFELEMQRKYATWGTAQSTASGVALLTLRSYVHTESVSALHSVSATDATLTPVANGVQYSNSTGEVGADLDPASQTNLMNGLVVRGTNNLRVVVDVFRDGDTPPAAPTWDAPVASTPYDGTSHPAVKLTTVSGSFVRYVSSAGSMGALPLTLTLDDNRTLADRVGLYRVRVWALATNFGADAAHAYKEFTMSIVWYDVAGGITLARQSTSECAVLLVMAVNNGVPVGSLSVDAELRAVFEADEDADLPEHRVVVKTWTATNIATIRATLGGAAADYDRLTVVRAADFASGARALTDRMLPLRAWRTDTVTGAGTLRAGERRIRWEFACRKAGSTGDMQTLSVPVVGALGRTYRAAIDFQTAASDLGLYDGTGEDGEQPYVLSQRGARVRSLVSMDQSATWLHCVRRAVSDVGLAGASPVQDNQAGTLYWSKPVDTLVPSPSAVL